MIAMKYVLFVCFAVTVIGATATRSNNLLSAIVKNGNSIASRNLLSVQEKAAVTYNNVLNDPCTGEDVNVIVEYKETYTFSYTDNTYHVSVHSVEHISGVGVTTGATYHGVDNASLNINFNVAVGIVYNDRYKYKLVTQGPNNNYNFNFSFHIMVDTNGQAISSRDNFSITCK